MCIFVGPTKGVCKRWLPDGSLSFAFGDQIPLPLVTLIHYYYPLPTAIFPHSDLFSYLLLTSI